MNKKWILLDAFALVLVVMITFQLYESWINWDKANNIDVLRKGRAKTSRTKFDIPKVAYSKPPISEDDALVVGELNPFHRDRDMSVKQEQAPPPPPPKLLSKPAIIGVITIAGVKTVYVDTPKRPGSKPEDYPQELVDGAVWEKIWKVQNVTDEGFVLEAEGVKEEIKYEVASRRGAPGPSRQSASRGAADKPLLTVGTGASAPVSSAPASVSGSGSPIVKAPVSAAAAPGAGPSKSRASDAFKATPMQMNQKGPGINVGGSQSKTPR